MSLGKKIMNTSVLVGVPLALILAFGTCRGDRLDRETMELAAQFVWTDPPGTLPPDDEFKRKLTFRLASHGDDYVPRTHHLRDDGTPLFTNRLILENSPYLLQHALLLGS